MSEEDKETHIFVLPRDNNKIKLSKEAQLDLDKLNKDLELWGISDEIRC